jgi:hypothetical protein
MLPDHITITPAGTEAWTKAVVAICVVLVPYVAVGAKGVPVRVGEPANTLAPVPVSSVKAAAKLAEDGVPKNVATPVPKEVIPVPPEAGNKALVKETT